MSCFKIAFVAAWLLCICQCAFADLKIGFVGDLSGPAAAYGIGAKNGLELALQEADSKKVSVIYEDDQYQPAKTVAAFRKLTEQDHVDVIITLASTCANAIAPLAQAEHVPLIAWANDPKVAKGRSYVMLSEPSSEAEGGVLGDEIVQSNYNRVGLVTAVGDAQSMIKQIISEAVPNRIAYQEEVQSDEKDFRSTVVKMKQKNLDALLLCLHPGQFGILAKQSKELGIKLPILGCNTMEDPAELSAAGGALDNALYVALTIEPSFEKRYQATFGNSGIVRGAAIHYELGRMLISLAEKQVSKESFFKTLMALPSQTGVLGLARVTTKNDVQYLDIPLVKKRLVGVSQIH